MTARAAEPPSNYRVAAQKRWEDQAYRAKVTASVKRRRALRNAGDFSPTAPMPPDDTGRVRRLDALRAEWERRNAAAKQAFAEWTSVSAALDAQRAEMAANRKSRKPRS